VRQVDPFGYDTCVLLPDGSPQCWGDGYPDGENQPTGTYTEIGAGGGGSCGLTAASSVSCWELPDTGFHWPPPSSGTYTEVVGGYDDDCALSTSGALTCWGIDQLSLPGPFTAIADGYQGACAITTSAAIGCYSMGSTYYSSPPQGTYTAVTLGGDFGCALSTAQAVSCWGDDADGQANAPATGRYAAVSAGTDFACALSTTGEITCWGSNIYGQLNSPAGRFTAIDAGPGLHACAIAASGYVHCWGYDNFGQLGMPPYLSPGPIPGGLAGFVYFADLGLPGVSATGDLDGTPPGTFTVTKGAIPPGLTLDPLYGLLQGITTTTGDYPFTVSISNVEASVSVRYDIIVRGYFLGFRHPAAGSRISRSARSVPVSFRIGSYDGTPVPASQALNLRLKVTLSRAANGSQPLSQAACSYRKAARAFQCTLPLPKNIAKGRYFLTAYQQTGYGYKPCPEGKARSDLNPEPIHIRG
jgi:hypothetical protein